MYQAVEKGRPKWARDAKEQEEVEKSQSAGNEDEDEDEKEDEKEIEDEDFGPSRFQEEEGVHW